MFNRKEYIQWLKEQQNMANPHLRNQIKHTGSTNSQNIQEGPVISGIRGLSKLLRKSPTARSAAMWGLGGAGLALGKNLTRKRDPATGELESDQPKKSVLKSAIKGAAMGAIAHGLYKTYKSGALENIINKAREEWNNKRNASSNGNQNSSSTPMKQLKK